MNSYRQVTDKLYWVGGSDRRLALFENIHPLPHGVSYNSYLLLDDKTALVDCADWAVGRQFLDNTAALLNGRPLDYLILNHVEPDHAATIREVLLRWPGVTIVTADAAAAFLGQFGYDLSQTNLQSVTEGDTLSTGTHTLRFLIAPMVHWPEVLMTFDATDGVLFSADAFGSFGALDGKLFADEFDFDRELLGEARRYYGNIVGKFGRQVGVVLEKASGLDIKYICPLHGPVWRKDLGYILDKYALWAGYKPEEKGVLIVYASMYGNTEAAAEGLAQRLAERGITNTCLRDVSRTHVSELISDVFRFSHLVFASVTYNLGIFPPMHDFLADMQALCLRNRLCAVVECGTWAIRSGTLIREALKEMEGMTVLEPGVTIRSSLAPGQEGELDALADTLAASLR